MPYLLSANARDDVRISAAELLLSMEGRERQIQCKGWPAAGLAFRVRSSKPEWLARHR